ncbi:hypothetical protein GCM10010246_07140 [Streptomyces cuspidosporus]|uniref:Uncharacterized protein n=1 Tax=Streptomyces cuspidosporus TaxID=66882 RepID=A0ABN3FDF8_9ACTN
MYEVTSATVGVTKTVRPQNAYVNRFPDNIALAGSVANRAKDADFAARIRLWRLLLSSQKLTFY